MFEEILGLPLHPLAVHVPVVLVPLLALVAAGYALVPTARAHLTWAAVFLAVVAPLSAWLGKLSGDALLQRLYQGQFTEPISEHSDWGNRLLYAAAVLGVLTLALVWTRRRGARVLPGWLTGALTVLVVLAAVVAGWFIYQVGHSGAEAHWGGL